VTFTWFERRCRDAPRALAEAAERYARFLGKRAVLAERLAGGRR